MIGFRSELHNGMVTVDGDAEAGRRGLGESVYPFRDSPTCENDWYVNQYNPGLCPAVKP